MREQTFTALAGDKKPVKRLKHSMTPRRRFIGYNQIHVTTALTSYTIEPKDVPKKKPRKRILPKVQPLPAIATNGTHRRLS